MTEVRKLIVNQMQSVLSVYEPYFESLCIEDKQDLKDFKKCLKILKLDSKPEILK